MGVLLFGQVIFLYFTALIAVQTIILVVYSSLMAQVLLQPPLDQIHQEILCLEHIQPRSD